MEASRERNGNMLPGTLVTGRIIRRMDSAFTSTRMEISMRVSGRETSATVKEPTGETRQANSGESIQVIGVKTRNTEEVLSFTRMAIVTTATGLQACLREKAE